MARDFPGSTTNNFSFGDLDVAVGTQALTVCCWLWVDSHGGVYREFISKWPGAGSGAYLFRLNNLNPRLELAFGSGVALFAEPSNLSAGQWYHALMRKSPGSLAIYRDGTSTASVADSQTVPNTADALVLGARSDGTGNPFDGKMAEFAVWDDWLTDAEIISLAKGFSPALIRPQSLQIYAPLLGNASPEPNLMGGANATLTGAVPKSDHPRIIVPRPAIYLP